MTDTDFNTALQKTDPDRRLAALFAEPARRQALLTIYAFNQEIGRIAEATSESLIGEMKLTWWRDAVADLYADPAKVRRHDVTEGLAKLTGSIAQAELQTLIDARFDDVGARPFTSLEDVLAYVDDTAGLLMRLGVRVLAAEADEDQLRAAARAWGLTGLLRAFPHRAQIGRAPAPGDLLAAVDVTPAMLAQGLGGDRLGPVLSALRNRAETEYDAFRACGPIPAELFPAMGYVLLVPGYLKRLPRDPFQIAADTPLILRQFRLTRGSLTGR